MALKVPEQNGSLNGKSSVIGKLSIPTFVYRTADVVFFVAKFPCFFACSPFNNDEFSFNDC
jgi:hypothetical protein